jgi:hypothetical protein
MKNSFDKNIPLLQSWKKLCGYLPPVALGAIHIWLFQSLSISFLKMRCVLSLVLQKEAKRVRQYVTFDLGLKSLTILPYLTPKLMSMEWRFVRVSR